MPPIQSKSSRIKAVYTLILITCLFACQEKKTEDPRIKLLLGSWKRQPDPKENSPYAPWDREDKFFTFLSDTLVDTKQTYYEVIRSKADPRQYKFLGTTTKYTITNDTLHIYHTGRSKSKSSKQIKRITPDTLMLVNEKGKEMLYTRPVYAMDQTVIPDQIVLSSSGCFGPCPIINIIIKSTGKVIYYGEKHTEKIGFYEGQIAKEDFTKIEYEFRKANIEKLDKGYSAPWTDDEKISTTFNKDNKIINSISDYGGSGPDEFVWAYVKLRYLYQSLDLKKMDATQLPPYQALHYFEFQKGNKAWTLEQSESFLLWNYLKEGTKVPKRSDARFTLNFTRNYTWFPTFDGMMTLDNITNPYNENGKGDIDNIITDGRYYTFIINQDFVTIDIGFNFYDINKSIFREKRNIPG